MRELFHNSSYVGCFLGIEDDFIFESLGEMGEKISVGQLADTEGKL